MSNYTGFGSINDTLILIVYNNIIYNIKYRKYKVIRTNSKHTSKHRVDHWNEKGLMNVHKTLVCSELF